MSSLLPNVARMAALQQDCEALLPDMFQACEILKVEAGTVVLGVVGAALAARLKQRLPKLQDGLAKRGWQVSAIRIKVQVAHPPAQPPRAHTARDLPNGAVQAFAQLAETLEESPRNAALKEALRNLVRQRARR